MNEDGMTEHVERMGEVKNAHKISRNNLVYLGVEEK
jgi:hypothetical protein